MAINIYQDAANIKYLEPTEMWFRGVTEQDLRSEDVEKDYMKGGYWIRLNTPTHYNVAVKQCQLLDSWTQSR